MENRKSKRLAAWGALDANRRNQTTIIDHGCYHGNAHKQKQLRLKRSSHYELQ